MSLVEAPFLLLSALDGWLARLLPGALRLILWAGAAAVLSLELYRLFSPQERVKAMKGSLKQAQDRVSAFDGDFSEGWPLIRRMLGLALKRVWLVLPATLLACLPLLLLILWLPIAYEGQVLLPKAPAWLGGWEAVFLPTLILGAVAYKWARGIE